MTDVEKIRLKIGGAATATVVNDTALQAFLDEEGSVVGAAAAACEALAAHYAQAYDISTDDQSLKRSQRAKAFAAQAKDFRGLQDKDEGIGSINSEKVDGYNDTAVDNESIDGATAGAGHARIGWLNPDEVP